MKRRSWLTVALDWFTCATLDHLRFPLKYLDGRRVCNRCGARL